MQDHTAPASFALRFELLPAMRVSLEEMQKADIGRKYARKDKRPLDPPPVVRMRCYQTIQLGAGREMEEELRDLDENFTLGFVCHVDLIRPAGEQIVPDRRMVASSTRRSAMRQAPFHHDASMSTNRASQYTRPPQFTPGGPFDGDVPGAVVPSGLRGLTVQQYDSGPGPLDVGRLPEPWAMRPKVRSNPQTPFAAHGNVAPQEDATCTNLLAGETFAACSLVAYEGQRVAMFVFPDLAVRQEGHFFLRYRVFNICGSQTTPDVPILAECYGGPFEIFSTKSFPGLSTSTDLTKRLSLSGLRVNSRHRERRSWKKAAQDPSEYSTDSAQGNSVGSLGPSRAWCRTPDRRPYHRADPPTAASDSGSGDFAYTLPRYSALFNSDAQSARNALAEWQRREEARDQVAVRSQGDSFPTVAMDDSPSAYSGGYADPFSRLVLGGPSRMGSSYPCIVHAPGRC
ncbi:hypothetical protein K466DRAFT_584458 [Polyporus arcularius HHB13444]|uniref:Velvet domain-containing protein n=1 Tax=Polyporus arcularius HHB13444 TaxID=1314778 RepID=A0A5C3PIG1_9APHY|nr:hypothetical protein K466DRAFT_584458 [Polyporus arcularius HHB13444]